MEYVKARKSFEQEEDTDEDENKENISERNNIFPPPLNPKQYLKKMNNVNNNNLIENAHAFNQTNSSLSASEEFIIPSSYTIVTFYVLFIYLQVKLLS